MDKSYIAGFFDGEGSASIITVKHKYKNGSISYTFRPIITINQKTKAVLDSILDYLGYGHLDIVKKTSKHGGIYRYVVNSSGNVIRFVDDIAPYTFIKCEPLYLLRELARFQRENGGRGKYDRKIVEEVLELRHRVHVLNSKTRANTHLKYSKEIILKEYDDGIVIGYENGRRNRTFVVGKKRIKKILAIATIKCACGCGMDMDNKDKRGRLTKYIHGHNQKGRHWEWQKLA